MTGGASERPDAACPLEDGVHSRGATGQSVIDQVALLYEARSYEVVERRWQRREGDVDLIARHGKLVAFCEITAPGPMLDATQRRMRRLADRWLAEITPASGRSLITIRFDRATVSADGPVLTEDAF